MLKAIRKKGGGTASILHGLVAARAIPSTPNHVGNEDDDHERRQRAAHGNRHHVTGVGRHAVLRFAKGEMGRVAGHERLRLDPGQKGLHLLYTRRSGGGEVPRVLGGAVVRMADRGGEFVQSSGRADLLARVDGIVEGRVLEVE